MTPFRIHFWFPWTRRSFGHLMDYLYHKIGREGMNLLILWNLLATFDIITQDKLLHWLFKAETRIAWSYLNCCTVISLTSKQNYGLCWWLSLRHVPTLHEKQTVPKQVPHKCKGHAATDKATI